MKWWLRLLLDPQAGELAGGGGTPSSAGASDDPATFGEDDGTNNPGATETSGGTEDPAVSGATSAASGQVQQAAGWQSIRDVARSQGFQAAGQFQDDAAFLTHLLQQAQRAQQSDFHARLGQQLAPHASQIQGYLQQQAQAQPNPQAPKPWEAPEFDERWLQLVDRDPATGIYVAKPGADPAYAQKVNAFAEWKQKYDRNPAAVLNAMVEERARTIADERFDARYAERERQSAINSIVSQNAEWMYARDATGNLARDYMGQPQLSPVGAMYVKQLQAVKQAGVTDPRMQDRLAKQLVQAEHYAMQQQQNPGNPQNPQRQAATNAPPVNPGQAQPPSQRRVNPGATEPSATGKTLSDMLRESLAAEGVTDDDISRSIG